jgi:hypothetical protein
VTRARRFVAVAAMLCGGVTVTTALPAATHAATPRVWATAAAEHRAGPHSPLGTPASCGDDSQSSIRQTVDVDLCNGYVSDMASSPHVTFYGHIEYTGPYGLIGNSGADQEIYSGPEYGYTVGQSLPTGNSYWCATLWQNAGGYYVNLNTTCVTEYGWAAGSRRAVA